jgi:hypothetical protein
MSKPDAKQPRCSYYDALAAIGLMKGIAMIDVARDDALIGALMELELPRVRQIVEVYNREELGYPTAEKIEALVAARGLAAAKHERAPEPEPKRVVSIHTVGGRLLDVAWGVVTGIATALAVGWMAPVPWLRHLTSWVSALPVDLLAR